MSDKTIKKLIILIFFCFFTLLLIAGCNERHEELEQKKKPADFKANEETLIDEEVKSKETPAQFQPNTPPKIIKARILPDPAYTNTDLRVEVEAEDIDGDLITYSYQWVKIKKVESAYQSEDLLGETDSTLSHDKFVKGDVLAVKVTPYDWYSNGLTYQTKPIVIVNSPPEIISSPPKIIMDDGVYTYQVKAIDIDNDPITFSLGEEAPEGMTIDSKTGLLTWSITPKLAGTYKITIYGDDGNQGRCFQRFTLTIKYKPSEK